MYINRLVYITNPPLISVPSMLKGGGRGGSPPGSGGVPHYYLPPQFFRLCNMPVLCMYHRVQDVNFRLGIQVKVQFWPLIKKESYSFSYVLTKLSTEPTRFGIFLENKVLTLKSIVTSSKNVNHESCDTRLFTKQNIFYKDLIEYIDQSKNDLLVDFYTKSRFESLKFPNSPL